MAAGILNKSILVATAILLVFLYACKKEITYTTIEKPVFTLTAADPRLRESEIRLVKDTVYILAANLVRNAGQVLTIDAGTLIKVNDNIGITINTGGIIAASGTQQNPVVFTANTQMGVPGRLVSNNGSTVSYAWNGISVTGSNGVSSGNINFVRIEFAGRPNGISGEAPLSLHDVDKSTTIDNVQASYSYEAPSFNISGGNVNLSNLVSYASFLSDFIIENGYTGNMQNILAYRHPFFALPGGVIAGVLIRGGATYPAISNLTVLGPDTQQGVEFYKDSLYNVVGAVLIKGGKFHIRNSVLAGFPATGFHVDNREAAISLSGNLSDFSYSVVQSNAASRAFFLTPNIYRPYTAADLTSFLLRPQYNNQRINSLTDLGFTDPFSYDIKPDPMPKAGSPLLVSPTDFSGADPFFKRVNYVGAFGSENWMEGWVNFIPLQTDYNK